MAPEQVDILVLGSGFGGKLLAWDMARSGRRTAVIERRWVGGSCPNVACMPSKNEIWSARIAHLAREAGRFGIATGTVKTDMAAVRRRKSDMVGREVELHLQNYRTTGAELIMGSGRFVAPKTIEVSLNDGGTRLITGERIFLNIGTHAAVPDIPGLKAAEPLTHIEALELDYLPAHLIVVGGGYVGLEMAQAYRRFGSSVTIIEPGPRIISREDPDVAAVLHPVVRVPGTAKTSVHRLSMGNWEKPACRRHGEHHRLAAEIEVCRRIEGIDIRADDRLEIRRRECLGMAELVVGRLGHDPGRRGIVGTLPHEHIHQHQWIRVDLSIRDDVVDFLVGEAFPRGRQRREYERKRENLENSHHHGMQPLLDTGVGTLIYAQIFRLLDSQRVINFLFLQLTFLLGGERICPEIDLYFV